MTFLSVHAARRSLLLALSASLTACVVAPPRQVNLVASGPVAVMRIGSAPPPPIVEIISAAPAPHWYWIGGHWRWDGQRYGWENGHWVEPRAAEVFVQARWSLEGGSWVYHPAFWRRVDAAAPPSIAVLAPNPPPVPRYEPMPPLPGPNVFWISGHWRWDRGQHVWESGHWEGLRAATHWAPAYWVQDRGGWRYVEGHWQRD